MISDGMSEIVHLFLPVSLSNCRLWIRGSHDRCSRQDPLFMDRCFSTVELGADKLLPVVIIREVSYIYPVEN